MSLISHSEFNVGVRHGVRAEAIIGMENTDDERMRSWPSPSVILAADFTFKAHKSNLVQLQKETLKAWTF